MLRIAVFKVQNRNGLPKGFYNCNEFEKNRINEKVNCDFFSKLL